MKEQRFQRIGRRRQGGWVLPLMLVLGAVLLMLSSALYFILNKEFKMNATSVTSDRTFQGGDAALNRAATWLEANWSSTGEENGGNRYDSLTTTPFTDIPGLQYSISITAGALALTYSTSSYVPVSMWANVGDLAYDRTIFAQVTDLSATNNAESTRYYYSVIHRDNQCRALFADPLVAVQNIQMGALDQGSCYTLKQLQTGNTTTSCMIAHQVAGNLVVAPASCYTPISGGVVCISPIPTPNFPCPLPGFSLTNQDFFFPTPTYTPKVSPTFTPSPMTSPPTFTMTPSPTPTTASSWPTNMPSFCYAVQAICGGYSVDSGSTIDSYPVTGHGGLNVAGGNVNWNGGTVTGVTTVSSVCNTSMTCVPTPAGLAIIPSANLYMQNCSMTLTLAAGNYSQATENATGCFTSYGTGITGGGASGEVVYLSGGNYIFNNIVLQNGATLVSAAGATTIVWLTGSGGTIGSGSSMGCLDHNPQNFFLMYCGSGDLNLNAGSGFYGFVYAPNANVNIDSGSVVYGGLISKGGTANSNASVYFPYNNGNCYGPTTTSPTQVLTVAPANTNTPVPTSTPVSTNTYTPCAPGALNLTSTTKALYLGTSSGNAAYVYECNNFDLDTGSIYVDLRGGSVTLYIQGNLICNATANPAPSIFIRSSPLLGLTMTSQTPANIFTVYVYGQIVALSSTGTYNMALAAPSASVIFGPGSGAGPGTFNGAIMAANITNTGGAMIFNYPLDIAGHKNYWNPPVVLQGWRKYLGP